MPNKLKKGVSLSKKNFSKKKFYFYPTVKSYNKIKIFSPTTTVSNSVRPQSMKSVCQASAKDECCAARVALNMTYHIPELPGCSIRASAGSKAA